MTVKKYFFPVLLIFISLIPLFDLFHPGLPITHDGQDHLARISNFYQNLKEGAMIPRWAGNLNWGYGHPILMFLYPLPSYIASIFLFLGFSLVDATKLVFGVAFIASGLAMYLFVQSFLGERAGFLAGLLYIFAPYRFVDLYVRGAIGEHVAFVFLPLILYFMLKLSQLYRHSGERSDSRISTDFRDSGQARMTIKYWFILGGSLSLAGLILSHNAITLMFLPIIFLYGVYLIFQTKRRKYFILNILYLILLGFGLSSFFIFPAFFEGKYTLRDIVTANEYASRFVQVNDFIYGSWNYGGTGQFTVQLGVVQWLITFFSLPLLFFLYRTKNKLWIFVISLLVILFFTFYLMIPQSLLIWEKFTILQKFQFPWRFLSVTVFVTSLLAGICMFLTPKKFQNIIIIILIFFILWFNKDFWYANGYLDRPENFFTNIYLGTTDTGESAPIWSVRFMEKKPQASIEIIDGKGEIKELSRTSTSHVYEAVLSKKSRLRENTLYFPGWEIYIDGSRVVDVEFQDPRHRGLMTFFADEGTHIIKVEFKETKLRMFANGVTVISAGLFLAGLIAGRKRWLQFL